MTVRCPGRRRGSLRWVVLAGVLSACGGGGGSETADPTVSTDVTTVPSTVSTAAAVESADPACAAGEQRVVTAFEMDSGAVRWVACSPEAGARWIAGASTDLVYVTVTPRTSNGEADGGGSILVALDTRTGSERWRISLGSGFPRVPSGPFLGDGLVVLVLADGIGTADLLGIDPATGVTVWTTAVPAGGVAVGDDVVVGAGGPITAYDRATGAPRWSIPGSGGYSDPVIGDGVVVVPSDAGLVALDLESGEEVWRTTDTLPGVPGGVEDGILVHGGQDDPTTGVDVRTGEVLWTQPGHSTYDDVFALGDGAAYMFDFGAGDGGATSRSRVRGGDRRDALALLAGSLAVPRHRHRRGGHRPEHRRAVDGRRFGAVEHPDGRLPPLRGWGCERRRPVRHQRGVGDAGRPRGCRDAGIRRRPVGRRGRVRPMPRRPEHRRRGAGRCRRRDGGGAGGDGPDGLLPGHARRDRGRRRDQTATAGDRTRGDHHRRVPGRVRPSHRAGVVGG